MQLVAYGFGLDAELEGRLVGALERIESGGTLRVRDALFAARDAESGELVAVEARGRGIGGFVVPLLSFRIDPHERREVTARTLAGPSGDAVRRIGEALQPGFGLAAMLIEHVWADVLEDAVARSRGTALLDARVEGESLALHADALTEASAAFSAARMSSQ